VSVDGGFVETVDVNFGRRQKSVFSVGVVEVSIWPTNDDVRIAKLQLAIFLDKYLGKIINFHPEC
ncbi:hypothetical protein E4U11_000541, partial [Claviceps purpurea]